MKITFVVLLMFQSIGFACSVECHPVGGECRYCHQSDNWTDKPGHTSAECKTEKHYVCTSLDEVN